jgi:hypothetical protein
VEIWIDSVALQPFTEKQWESHQYQSIEKVLINFWFKYDFGITIIQTKNTYTCKKITF